MWRRSAAMFVGFGALAQWISAQGPTTNAIQVKLDRTAIVGSQTLPPGDYTIRQLTSSNNSRVLEFTTNRGTNLAATVTANALLQNTPPSETKIVFDSDRSDRITKILVQGRDYGYEFPNDYSYLRTDARATTMQLRYNAPEATAAEAQSSRETVTTAQNQTPANTEANRPDREPAAPPANVGNESPAPQAINQAPQEPVITAQNTPPAAQPPTGPTQQTSPAQQPEQTAPAAPAEQSSQAAPAAQVQQPTQANQRAEADTAAVVPATALGWADQLLIGLGSVAVSLWALRLFPRRS